MQRCNGEMLGLQIEAHLLEAMGRTWPKLQTMKLYPDAAPTNMMS